MSSVAACGQEAADPSASSPSGSPASSPGDATAFAQLVAGLSHSDYGDLTPEETWANADLVGAGEVVSIEEGRVTDTAGVAQPHVVIVIKPIRVAGRAVGTKSDPIYIELERPVDRSVEEYAKTLSPGTQFAFALRDVTEAARPPVENQEAGRTPGSRLYAPVNPMTWVGVIDGQLGVIKDPERRVAALKGWGSPSTVTAWVDLVQNNSNGVALGAKADR